MTSKNIRKDRRLDQFWTMWPGRGLVEDIVKSGENIPAVVARTRKQTASRYVEEAVLAYLVVCRSRDIANADIGFSEKHPLFSKRQALLEKAERGVELTAGERLIVLGATTLAGEDLWGEAREVLATLGTPRHDDISTADMDSVLRWAHDGGVVDDHELITLRDQLRRPPSQPKPSTVVIDHNAVPNHWLCFGEYFEISFKGRFVHLKRRVGLEYLAVLLQEDKDVGLDALVAEVDGVMLADDDENGSARTMAHDELAGDLERDAPLKRKLSSEEKKLLRHKLYEARKLSEHGDAEAQVELKRLRAVEHQLDPRRGSHAKRIQNRVSKGIDDALKALERESPELASFLTRHLRYQHGTARLDVDRTQWRVRRADRSKRKAP